MFNIAIVDNNSLFLHDMAEKVREAMYSRHQPFYVQSYDSADSLISDLSAGRSYDLLFMDIRLEEQENGIESAKHIRELCSDILIVFVTYYPQYYLDVYEVPHIYLVTKDRLDELLPKALDTALDLYMHAENETVTIRTKSETNVIRKRDILFLEKDLRRIILHTKENDYMFYSSTEDILKKLGNRFIRCHRSYIINADHVVRIEGDSVILTNDIRIPLSRTYSRSVLEVLSRSSSAGGIQ